MDLIHWWPSWKNVADFLDAFWPEAAATGLGVALGLPAARSFERWRHRRERADAEVEAGRRRQDAAAVLIKSLVHNATEALSVADRLGGSAFLVTNLELSAWDIVKDDVIELFPDVGLRSAIAQQYEGFEEFGRLVRLQREYSLGINIRVSGNGKLLAQIAEHATTQALRMIETVGPILLDLLDLAGGIASGSDRDEIDSVIAASARLSASSEGA